MGIEAKKTAEKLFLDRFPLFSGFVQKPDQGLRVFGLKVFPESRQAFFKLAQRSQQDFPVRLEDRLPDRGSGRRDARGVAKTGRGELERSSGDGVHETNGDRVRQMADLADELIMESRAQHSDPVAEASPKLARLF